MAEAPVARVRLAWYSSGRSIKRLTVREVEKKLLALDSDALTFAFSCASWPPCPRANRWPRCSARRR
ncbi:hypothetical protein [Billgrantia tianxiuensis]|uniref:hypothetical protein n=1 Tax=Billgrantia tianxiuensis TaxID=2497861 RepID=UPI0030ECF823